jgi:hypothetical protein
MNNVFRLASATLVFTLAACGGGGSSTPTAPTATSPPPGPLSTAIVLVLNVSATVEPTSTGVLYRNTLTLNEASHRSGATIASIRVNLSSATRNASATFDRNDNIVTALASGGSNVYLLNVTSDNRDPFTQVAFFVTYTDSAGTGGTFTSPTGTGITPVAAANTPPVLTPGAPSGRFDGSYDFFYTFPTSLTSGSSNTIPRFLIIRNGVISSADGTMAGKIDNFGYATFTWPCIINSSLADFNGSMDESALSGFNFGKGDYACRMHISGTLSWSARQSR